MFFLYIAFAPLSKNNLPYVCRFTFRLCFIDVCVYLLSSYSLQFCSRSYYQGVWFLHILHFWSHSGILTSLAFPNAVSYLNYLGASLVAQMVKRLPAMRETRVWFLGREDPLEKEMAIHSSTLAWKSPWTEEPDRIQSMGSHGRRSLIGYSPWGHEESDMTEQLHFHFHYLNYHHPVLSVVWKLLFHIGDLGFYFYFFLGFPYLQSIPLSLWWYLSYADTSISVISTLY